MLVTCSFTCEVLLIDPCECTPFALLDSGATFALSFPLVFVDAAEQNKTEQKITQQKRTAMSYGCPRCPPDTHVSLEALLPSHEASLRIQKVFLLSLLTFLLALFWVTRARRNQQAPGGARRSPEKPRGAKMIHREPVHSLLAFVGRLEEPGGRSGEGLREVSERLGISLGTWRRWGNSVGGLGGRGLGET